MIKILIRVVMKSQSVMLQSFIN